jgi:hypothetical protein
MLEATDVEAQLLKRDLQGFGHRQSAYRALVEANFRIGELIAVAAWSELGDCRRFLRSEQVVRHSGLDVSVGASDRHRAPWLPDPAGTADVALGAVRSGDERVTPAQPRPHLLHDDEGPSRRQARRHCGGSQFARCCYHILRNLDRDIVYAMPSTA